MSLKEQILTLKRENPKLGSRKIAKTLGCGRATVRYYISPNTKRLRTASRNKLRKANPLKTKIERFSDWRTPKFTEQQLLDKIGTDPKCYLSGKPIDLSQPATYHLDHRIPRCQGGTNELNNCEIASKEANLLKGGNSPTQLFEFCTEVLTYNGFVVIPPLHPQTQNS